MSKWTKFALALGVVALALGWRQWQGRVAEPASAATAARAPAAQPASAAVDTGPAATRRRGALQFTPCTLTSAIASDNVEAQCATLSVAENPAAPDGRHIDLKIAWLTPTEAGADEPDPVFFIAGGPGQSATETASVVEPALRELRKKRDLFFVDQRGTGGSAALLCRNADGSVLDEPRVSEPTPARLAEYAAQCAAGLKGRADPRFYTTTEAIADLDAVRVALGVEQIDLIGVSYGTRVAQQYAKRYPAHARSLVLDGVAPNDLVVGGEFAHTFDDAIALQSEQCRREPGCARRFPVDTRQQLRNVMDRLRQAPVEVDYRHPGTGEVTRGTVTADTVTGLAFAFSYAPQTAALLPLTLDEAAQGRYAPLMSLAELATHRMGGAMNRAMQWSVICAEDADRYQSSIQPQGALFGPEVARMFFSPCAVWPTGKRPADFTAPLRSPVPTLLLSGELDPVTPPRYAERVLAGLPNGRHVIAPGQGHNVLGQGCIPKLVGAFIDTADARALDVSCVETLTEVPAFTSFNGWEP